MQFAEFVYLQFGGRAFTEEQLACAFDRYAAAIERADRLYTQGDDLKSRLAPDQRRAIRYRLAAGEHPRSIAPDYQLTAHTIRKLA